MYAKVNVDKPGRNYGIGGNKKDKIILFDFEDVLNFPSRDSKGVVITDNITFKPGAHMITIYGTVDKIKSGSSSEGEIDAEGFIHTLEFEHPGNSVEIREFKTNWVGCNIGAVVQYCNAAKKDLFGTPCAPLRMQTKWEDTKDKNSTVITLKQAAKCEYEVGDYQGTLTYDSPVDTVAADATTVDLAEGEGRYQLTDGTAAPATLTTCTNAVDGMVFTLLGSGGTHPSTIAGTDFLLSNGTAWTALEGAEITFKAFKSGNNAWKFIELSRK
jgi:hypothetical protein